MNKKIAGFLIISAALISLAIWELWGRENISYREILVLTSDLPTNTIVEEEHIDTKKIEAPSPKALGPDDVKKVIGMETAQFVAEDVPLYDEYFRQSRFATGEGTDKEILSIPEDWLLSLPQTLRRGDTVTFYNEKVKILTAVVVHARDSSNQEVLSDDKERFQSTGVTHNIEIIGNTAQLVELSRLAAEGKKFTVLYY